MALTKRAEMVKEILISERGIKRRNDAPFPQANSVDKLLDVLRFAKKRAMTKDELQKSLPNVHKRQVDYYINALVYLGALKERDNTYSVDKVFYKVSEKEGLLEFMLKNQILRETATLYLITKKLPTEEEITQLLIKHGNIMGESTNLRRVKTVQSWTKWILNKK